MEIEGAIRREYQSSGKNYADQISGLVRKISDSNTSFATDCRTFSQTNQPTCSHLREA
jgi:hypothetical protein